MKIIEWRMHMIEQKENKPRRDRTQINVEAGRDQKAVWRAAARKQRMMLSVWVRLVLDNAAAKSLKNGKGR